MADPVVILLNKLGYQPAYLPFGQSGAPCLFFFEKTSRYEQTRKRSLIRLGALTDYIDQQMTFGVRSERVADVEFI